MNEVDYTKCNLEDLLDARRRIDEKSYPDRVAQLDLLIRDRTLNRGENHTQTQQNGKIATFKRGRGRSGLEALGAIGGTVAGLAIIITGYAKNKSPEFLIFGVVFLILGLAAAAYHLYNMFSRNRFTEYDMMRPDLDKDPVERALGLGNEESRATAQTSASPRRFEGEFCPFCGAPASDNFDCCPKCGKDI